MWLRDEVDDPLAHGSRRAQSLQELAGQLGADRVVAEEVAVGEGRRLADVVDEGREPDDRPARRRRVDGSAACGPRGPRLRPCSAARRAARPGPRRSPARSPVSASSRSPTDGVPAASSLSSSVAIRSPERWRDQLGRRLDAGQRRGLDVEARASRRAARSRTIRSASSSNRCRWIADRTQQVRRGCRRRRRTGPRAPGEPAASAVAPHAIALHVRSRRARSTLDRVAELDPVRPTEVGVVVVGAERRDLVDVATVDGSRPSRTGSRRRSPGSAPGPARAARRMRGPSPRPGARGARRAASRRRRTPRGRRPRGSRAGRGPRTGSRPAGSARAVASGSRRRQFRPRNRYVRHASLFSSARYGVNSE